MAANNLFSVDFHKKLQTQVENSYRELISDLREDMAAGFETTHLTEDFQKQFAHIIQDRSLDNYSPLAFYWSSLLENLIYVIQLHEDGDEAEEDIFDFWNESEYAASFHELLASEESVFSASQGLRVLLENQVLAFYYLHLDDNPRGLEEPLLYRIVPEIGDHPERIYLTDKHYIVDMDQTSNLLPNIALANISQDRSEIEVEIDKAFSTFKIKSQIQAIEENLYLLPQCEAGKEQYQSFKEKINDALEIIKKCSPECYQTFKSFTRSLVPVNEKGIVSYSMQSLPGYSCINMFERDFVDLIDDLIHENGHHYLNTFLNHTDLINEDDEKIFYSPWRRALRPIRGIYHAVFTFYWAFKLFSDLSENLDLFESEQQKQKVLIRASEEYYMLDYCRKDLEHAYEQGKITPTGKSLIEDIYSQIDQLKTDTAKLEESLNSENKSKLEELKNTLIEKKEHYDL